MNYDLRKNNRKKGFSLVEVLVSVAIISLAITGPIMVSEHNFKTSVYSREKVTAGFLATEALEYTRYLITANNLKGIDWLSGLSECLGVDKWCGYDPTNSVLSDKIVSCSLTSNDCLLSINSANGIYTHRTGSGYVSTQFKRQVNIVDLESGTGHPNIQVIVKIIWNSQGFKDGSLNNQELVLTEKFFDWRSQPNN